MCVDLVLAGNVRPQFRQVEQLIDGYTVELGGSANIFATQFVKLGGQVGIVGWAGLDLFGDFALEKLRGIGVDTSRISRLESVRTGLGVTLAEPGDRAILTYSGTIGAVQPKDLSPKLLALCRHWHIASYFLLAGLRDFWREWLLECQRERVTVSLDTNWDPESRWTGILELLPWIDVFLPNEAEALAISCESSVERAGVKLASYGPTVVIKLGPKGAMAFRQDQHWSSDARNIEESPHGLVDTIGAGDNFDAGFLRGWLFDWDTQDCLNLACRCASESLQAAGGIEGQLCEIVSRSM